MSIVCAVQSIFRRNSGSGQQGMVSVTLLCLLFVMLFLGQALFVFAREGAENIQYYRTETQLRLAAEGAAESLWSDLERYEAQLQELREGEKINLQSGNEGEMEVYAYVLMKDGKMYIIATAFRRVSDLEKKVEPHCMVKAEIKKVKDENGKAHYKWLGWTA